MMNFSKRIAGVALASAGVALFQFASPAGAATFDFTTGTTGNQTVKSFLASGIGLTASNSNSTGNNPGTLNNVTTGSVKGLCAFASVTNTGICGYGSTAGSGVSSFQLKFDKPVLLNAFNVETFDFASGSGSVGFSLDNTNFQYTSFNSAGDKTLSSVFAAAANQTVYVRTTGGTNGVSGGLIRLGSLTANQQVPAPLPILGAAVGFRFSRRIRKRIGAASLQA